MATIAAGTWYTQQKGRSKYKMYDTTVYVSHIFFEMNVDVWEFHREGGERYVIEMFLATEEGKWLIDKIKDPDVIFSNNYSMAMTKCVVQAYIQEQDLVLYKLQYGA